MKKVLVFLTLLLGPASMLVGQSENSVRLGIKLSPNLAWIRADSKGLESDGNVVGYKFGLMTEFPFGANGNYRFATGIMLNNLGGKITHTFSADDTNFVATSDVKLRYIDIPITVKLMTNEIGYMRYFGQLGVDASANIRAKSDSGIIRTASDGSTTRTEEDDLDVKDAVNVFKMGLVIGGGAEYNFSGGTSILFGVAYHSAFTTLFKKDAFRGLNKPKTFADYVELSLGVFF